MAKENGAPTAEEKGKGKAVEKPTVDGEKKSQEVKKDKDGKPIKDGKDAKDLELAEGPLFGASARDTSFADEQRRRA